MNRKSAFFCALLTLGLICSTAGAAIERVVFREAVSEDGIEMRLRGAGILTYLIFYEAYAGAFYLPEAIPSTNALDDVPRCLIIEYFHAIQAEDFASATTRKVKDNLDAVAFNSIQARLDRLNSAYQDVTPGDRYTLVYIPGSGTTLKLNDLSLVRIEGADFARAVFAIWLGDRPIDKGFKRKLLGAA